MVVEINNRTKSKIDLKLVKSVAAKFAHAYKIGGQELSVAFVSSAEMKKLNRLYRRLDKTTDTLSFAGEGNLLGELVMDYGQIKRQAKSYGNSARKELIFVLVHGLLHLLGYNDETEAARLRVIKLGEEFIKNNL